VSKAPFTVLSDIDDVFYWDTWARRTVLQMAGAPAKLHSA